MCLLDGMAKVSIPDIVKNLAENPIRLLAIKFFLSLSKQTTLKL